MMVTTTATTTTTSTSASPVVTARSSTEACNTPKRPRKLKTKKQESNFPSTLKPPCDYESLYSSYLLEWKHQRETQQQPHVEIHDLLVVAVKPNKKRRVVVAVTSLGQVMIMTMNVTATTTTGDDDKNNNNNNKNNDSTKTVIDVSTKPLHAVGVFENDYNNNSNSMTLVVGGEEGMWTLELLLEDSGATETTTTNKLQKISNVPVKEIQVIDDTNNNNDNNTMVYALTTQEKEGYILRYTANGTLTTVYKNATKPATTFQFVASVNLLIVGTATSEVILWDVDKAKVVDTLSVTKAFCNNNNNNKGNYQNTNTKKPSSCSYKVTNILVTQEQWWTVGGERVMDDGSASGGGGGGFLCTWHGPTRAVVAQVETRETIQGLLLVLSSQGQDNGSLYSIANEAVVSLWTSPYVLERTHRIRLAGCPSGKAIAAAAAATTAVPGKQQGNNDDDDDDTPLLFVAGVGSKVDVLKDHCCVEMLETII